MLYLSHCSIDRVIGPTQCNTLYPSLEIKRSLWSDREGGRERRRGGIEREGLGKGQGARERD